MGSPMSVCQTFFLGGHGQTLPPSLLDRPDSVSFGSSVLSLHIGNHLALLPSPLLSVDTSSLGLNLCSLDIHR